MAGATIESFPIQSALVVGGGPGGLSAAIALGMRGVRATVVERQDGAVGAAIGFHYRPIYAIEELGILDEVMRVGDVVPLDQEELARAVYTAGGKRLPVATPDLGQDWALPVTIRIYRPYLAEIMRRAVCKHGGEVLLGHSYRSVQVLDDRVQAELTTGERREFDLLVAADGVHSALRPRFFPEAGDPNYTGSMSFRVMFDDPASDWFTGLHVLNGDTISTITVPRGLHLSVPRHMERRRIEQEEAREIVREIIAGYAQSPMFQQLRDRFSADVDVVVAPYLWILVKPPWHHGRIVLLGDAAHATAPTAGSAGGMAIEDGVVLAQELAKAGELDAGLSAYAARRFERVEIVVETSALLMRSHQERRPLHEENAMRARAIQTITDPY